MSENRYFDEFLDSFREPEFKTDSIINKEILRKAYKKINTKKRAFIKYAAAACVLIALVSGLIPNTPVNALYRTIFSFIPGVGVIQSDDESNFVKGVLAEPVRVEDGESFIEIESAFVADDTLRVSLKTNVGLTGMGSFKDAVDFKKFFAGETMPEIYLQAGDEKVKPNQKTMSGPSYETMVYSVNAGFQLINDKANTLEFSLCMDSFSKPVEIKLTKAQSGSSPAEVGNVAVMNDIMIIADTDREGDTLSVLLSTIAPDDFKNARCYLFDSEKASFDDSVKIVDKDGNVYRPDDTLRKQNNGEMNTFYFNIPHDKEGLKIVIPQVLYEKNYIRDDIRIAMPDKVKETVINKKFDLGGIYVSVNKASIVPAYDPLLPDEFKSFDCMMITAGATVDKGSNERVLRLIPNTEVPDGLTGYMRPSSAVNAELWSAGQQEGYSLTYFDGMEKAKRIQLTFTAECAMNGPWVIDLD